MFTLTIKDTVIAARKALEESRLGFQSLNTAKGCLYRYNDPGNHVCAIGAALPDEVVALIGNNTGIDDTYSMINVPLPDQAELESIQSQHDELCSQVRCDQKTPAEATVVFREFLEGYDV